jgi:hypothetical protein
MIRTPTSPAPTPTRPDNEICSRSHHTESGSTQSGVEKASTADRPGGRRVNATAVSADYVAIWKTPETMISRQSDRDGSATSPRSVAMTTRHAAPITYRRHANHIGETAATPTLITGQLAPQIKTRTARSQRERRSR